MTTRKSGVESANAVIEKRKKCTSCISMLVKDAQMLSRKFAMLHWSMVTMMRTFIIILRIDTNEFKYSCQNCKTCIRPAKHVLKSRSRLFRVINDLVDEPFDRWLFKIVSDQSAQKAKEFAEKTMKSLEEKNDD